MNTLHIKTGDTVIVLSGKDKGKKGKVLSCDPSKGAVIVEGVNFATKHQRARRQGEEGGIVKVEGAFYACKASLYCSKCGKGVRAAHKMDGDKKVRVCAKCGETL